MADGGVVVLVSWLVHVRPLLAVPQLLGDVGMLVPVQLGLWLWVSGMATHLPPGVACLLEPTQVAGPASPWLTATLTANPPTTGVHGGRRWTAIHVLSCADAAGGGCPSNLRVPGRGTQRRGR